MRISREYRPSILSQFMPKDFCFKSAPDFIHFMVIWDDFDNPVGCYTLIPHSDVCVFIHTFFKPEGYRNCVTQSLPVILNYVFNVVGWNKLLTEVPIFNILAKRLAIRAGMVNEGLWRASFKDENGVHDMEIFGLTKEDYKCQHFRF